MPGMHLAEGTWYGALADYLMMGLVMWVPMIVPGILRQLARFRRSGGAYHFTGFRMTPAASRSLGGNCAAASTPWRIGFMNDAYCRSALLGRSCGWRMPTTLSSSDRTTWMGLIRSESFVTRTATSN